MASVDPGLMELITISRSEITMRSAISGVVIETRVTFTGVVIGSDRPTGRSRGVTGTDCPTCCADQQARNKSRQPQRASDAESANRIDDQTYLPQNCGPDRRSADPGWLQGRIVSRLAESNLNFSSLLFRPR